MEKRQFEKDKEDKENRRILRIKMKNTLDLQIIDKKAINNEKKSGKFFLYFLLLNPFHFVANKDSCRIPTLHKHREKVGELHKALPRLLSG